MNQNNARLFVENDIPKLLEQLRNGQTVNLYTGDGFSIDFKKKAVNKYTITNSKTAQTLTADYFKVRAVFKKYLSEGLRLAIVDKN